MDKSKLNFRFHNSNSPESLCRILLKVCIAANMKKVERAVQDEIAAALAENKVEKKF